jgi:hypothetical protein
MDAPEITEIIPVFGIDSYAEAVAHYVDWLGFNLDWEWRETPTSPVIMAVSRQGASLMLNEFSDSATASSLVLKVNDLAAFAREWNGRRAGSAEIVIAEPYDIPTISVKDACGNHMDFQQPESAEEEALRLQRAIAMREYIRSRLDTGHDCPTAAEVVDAVGRPPGLAMDVLCEFPEYQTASQQNRKAP